MKNRFMCVAIVFFCFGLWFSCAQGAEKVLTLQFSNFLPSQDARSGLWEEWGKELEKRTNGRVKVNLYHGSTLTPPPQTFDSVMKGIVDVGYGGAGMTPGRFPMLEVTELPWGTKNSVNTAAMINAFYNKFKPKELEKVKVLILHGNQLTIHTRKQIRTLEDLKGMKVRTPGGSTTGLLQALGAVPLVISPGETYDALQKGVADGIAAGFDTLEVFKFGDVTKYTVSGNRGGVGGTAGYVVMNKEVWNSLPADIQTTVDKLSEEYGLKLARLFDQLYEQGRNKWEPKGHQFTMLSKAEDDRWAQKLEPVFDKYVKEKTAMGLPAAEAVAFCKDWVQKNVK